MNHRKLAYLILLGLLIIVFPIMNLIFAQSGDQTGFIASQLSFSAEFLKNQYGFMINYGNLNKYRWGQILDYGFMISYGGLIFVGAKSPKFTTSPAPFWKKTQPYVAIGGLGAAVCDGIENIFILLTLTNPLSFPPIWAIFHSIFALIKWLVLMSSLMWILVGLGVYVSRKRRN